jgi:uncharacterized membrane protein YjfL (UPF0719 family)
MYAFATVLLAQTQPIWADPYSFAMALLTAIAFGVVGISLAVVGFKALDKLTPGHLAEEILHKQNIAAAILAGAFILGFSIIVAAAIHG